MPASDANRPDVVGTDVGGTDSSGDLHQTLLREVNDEIARLNGDWVRHGREIVLCECGKQGCLRPIELSAAEYEQVRRFPTRFLVLPAHVALEGERIVQETDKYVVVEKVGEGAAGAIEHDPRRRTAAAS